MSADTLRARSFQGLQNLPIVAAQRQGYFARYDLDVTLSFTNSSAEQLAMLARGEVDLIHTAPDNVVNFDTHPEAFGCEPATAPRVSLLLGGSNGPLTIFARPELPSAADLRGRAVGVDNPGSGFALALRDLLARAGLELGRDYTFTVAGGTGARAVALAQGALAATIVYPPFDLLLASKGCHALATSTAVYPAYASQALAGVSAWVEAHSDVVTRYIAALLEALDWLYSPAERARVEALLAAEPGLGVSAEVSSAQAYNAFTDPVLGFGRTAPLDMAGIAQVIALRARYGLTGVTLGQPEDYCDLRWYERARALARG
ncbi:MAG TPA: ABC transporter substrate-binding protein [Ktedonobacterales bacterium]